MSPGTLKELSILIRKKKIQLSPCHFSKQFRQFKMRKPDSASKTRVAFARLLDMACTQKPGGTCHTFPVAAKMFFADVVHPALEYEAKVYKTAVGGILAKNKTPCLIEYVCYTKCPKWYTTKLANNKEINKYIDEIDAEVKPIPRLPNGRWDYQKLGPLSILITQRPYTVAADDLKAITSTEFWRPIVFQMVWTMWACMDSGLYHYDLHSGNYLIGFGKDAFQHDTVFALAPGEYFVIPKGTPKMYVFDWDRSWSKQVGNNPFNNRDICSLRYGCNRASPTITLYRTFGNMRRTIPQVKAFESTYQALFPKFPMARAKMDASIKTNTKYDYPIKRAAPTIGSDLSSVLRNSADFAKYRTTGQSVAFRRDQLFAFFAVKNRIALLQHFIRA